MKEKSVECGRTTESLHGSTACLYDVIIVDGVQLNVTQVDLRKDDVML